MLAQPDPEGGRFEPLLGLAPPPAPASHLDHLLKVAASVNRDANNVWAELWGQFKPHVTHGGVVHASLQKGFVPDCGWEEFLEKFWLLKHYLDSVDRICRNKH